MAKSAAELADLIVELDLRDKERAYQSLRLKCVNATEEMVKDRVFDTTVELTDAEISGLDSVTSELRELGYKFRFIERQKSDGETIGYYLLISIHHCK